MLIDIALGLVVFIALMAIYKLVITIKRKQKFKDIFHLDLVFILAAYLLLNTLFLGVIHIACPKTSHTNLLFLSAFTTVLANVIKPQYFYLRFKQKVKVPYTKTRIAIVCSFFIAFILEMAIFNTSAINSNYETTRVDITSEKINFINSETDEEGNIIIKDGTQIKVNTTDIDLNNIYFTFNDVSLDLYIRFYTANNASYEYNTNPKKDLYNYMSLQRVGKVDELSMVVFIDDSRYANSDLVMPTLILEGIEFNVQFPFSYNLLRQSLLTGLLCVIVAFKPLCDKMKVVADERVKDRYTKTQFGVLVLGGLVLISYFAITIIFKDIYYIRFKNVDIANTNIYFQQFDALLKGQLHLDLPVNERLAALDNPYDPTQRAGLSYYWDHAFYGGKYYSYYGIAPVILFMLPVYGLSGCTYIPSLVTVQQFGTILSVIALLLAEIQAVKVFAKNTNYSFTIFLLVASIFISLTLYGTTYKMDTFYEGIYHVPYAYGLTFMFLTFFMVLKAYKCETRMRSLYLGLSGLFIVLMVASRPNLLVTFIFVLPLYLKMLFKRENIKEKALNFGPCVGVVLSGAIALACYNYARFDSFIEFGQSYQLTVTDQTNIGINSGTLFSTIFHFFMQGPTFWNGWNRTPLLNLSYQNFGMESHPYVASTIGLFSIPLFLSIFFIPMSIKKDDDIYLKITQYMIPLAVFIIAFITAAYAGVCFRYMSDLFPLMTISSVITVVKLIDKYKDTNGLKYIYSISTIAILVSVVWCCDLLFNRFDGILGGDLNGILFDYTSLWGTYSV